MGNKNDNNFTFFYYTDFKFMMLSLEFSPTKDVICWANEIISKYSERRVIIVTHCYQAVGGERQTNCGCHYGLIGSGGDTRWNELVQKHSNIFIVLRSHKFDVVHIIKNGVHKILTDYQAEPKGGNGWLRFLKFFPENDLICVESISVLNDVTSFQHDKYSSNPESCDHKYSFAYQMNNTTSYDYNADVFGFYDRTVNKNIQVQQRYPAISTNTKGEVVIVYEADTDGSGYWEIVARGLTE